jgi:hypothetical protein
MNREKIKAELNALVAAYLPKNACSYSTVFFDGQPKKSNYGFWIDPEPFAGKVIARTDDAAIIKMGRHAKFAILDRQCVNPDPEEGDQVLVRPYVRRRFDGKRADTPLEDIRIDPVTGQSCSVGTVTILGKAIARLPILTPQSMPLQALVKVLEEAYLSGEHRQIAHMLVDADATDFEVIDTDMTPESSPEIGFNVSTAKFKGHITIRCVPGGQYIVDWQNRKEDQRGIGKLIESDKTLGATLLKLIDDGAWRTIQIEIIKAARKPRRAA